MMEKSPPIGGNKTKNEIPKQVRDDSNTGVSLFVMLNLGLMQIRLVSASPFRF
jgi:hypothetical protein